MTLDEAIAALLTGATVVLGVVLAEWLQRVRNRRQAIEDAAHRLSIISPKVTIAFSDVQFHREFGPDETA